MAERNLRKTRTGLVGHAAAEIHAGYLKGAAGTGGSLFEQQDDVLAGEIAVGNTGHLHTLELVSQVQQIADFFGGVVEQLQEVASSEIDRHGFVLLFDFSWLFYQLPRKMTIDSYEWDGDGMDIAPPVTSPARNTGPEADCRPCREA